MGDGAEVRIEDLIGSRVLTAEGDRVGRVVDLEVTPGDYRVTALVLGRYGWLERLDIGKSFAGRLMLRDSPSVIPWSAVARFEPWIVTLKPGTRLPS